MLTKKNLWFLTLFSIILVMAVYYVSVPTDNAGLVNKELKQEGNSVEINETSAISALRVSRDESLEQEISSIKAILTDETKTTEEKSDAYEALKDLNLNKGKEETLEKTIKENYNYENFVQIDNSNVKVVIDTDSHSFELANKIMKTVQESFDSKVYVTVSFGEV